jgi:hypothetical protein
MIQKLRVAYQLWRHFGTSWLSFRALYGLRQRAGILKWQLPATPWAQQPLAAFLTERSLANPAQYATYRRTAAPQFFFDAATRLAQQTTFQPWDSDTDTPLILADELAAGSLRYFEHTPAAIGSPPQWHKNPFTGQTAPVDRHWSELSDFGYGDIKIFWEPSRFGFVYALVRAYWRTGDEQYAESFWCLVEDWQQHNPPQLGLNWKCGQETTFRVMAWCFGLYGFLDAQATTAERITLLAQMIAVSGQRIAANIEYALSQRNNHGISEAMGLWTIGLLFPEFNQATAWRTKGQTLLEQLAGELIYDDGSFVQHSVNYQRVMLHDYLWAIRLGELAGHPLSQSLRDQVAKSGRFLYQLQDQFTGRVPHYGQMDGALVLPLNNCDYLDFRPIIQAIHYLSTGRRCYPEGPWDEDLLWFFGINSLQAPLQVEERESLQAKQGGYYTLRTQDSFIFTRCATYQDRPGQADMLHVDLWWRGQNIAIDPGTYSYNAPSPWNNPLAHSCYHNTVTVDGFDQMDRVGKFLWLPWLQSKILSDQSRPSGVEHYWEGEHNGYIRLSAPVRHRRALIGLPEDTWLIVDQLESSAAHTYRLHWLLNDLPYQWDEKRQCVELTTAAGPYFIQLGNLPMVGCSSISRAEQGSPRGWQAPYYFCRHPALSVEVAVSTNQACFWTLFSSQPGQLSIHNTNWEICFRSWQAQLEWSSDSTQSMFNKILIF